MNFKIALVAVTVAAQISSAALAAPPDVRVEAAPVDPAKVSIHRDRYGVPHVFARREAAAFYGLGYAHAQDKLEAMLRFYLAVRGQQAMHFGPQFIEADAHMRAWRFLEEARAGLRRLDRSDPSWAKDVRAYIAGVQDFLKDNPDRLPSWSPQLEPALPLAAWAAFAWPLAHQRGFHAGGVSDCVRGGVAIDFKAMFAAAGDLQEALVGSNEWILAPWRVADNVAVVLADSHGAIRASFESHVSSGDLHYMGFGLPGMILPYLGHNAYLGWGTSVGGPDIADCYEITTDAANPLRYRYDHATRQIEREEITIEVKGAAPVRRWIEYVAVNDIRVPVAARRGDKIYAAVSTLDNMAEATSRYLYHLYRARSADEWFKAADLVSIFPVNLMGADVDGNTFYLRAGRVPVRAPGYDWGRPVPGNTAATQWAGIHGVEDLVQLRNPAQGYMQNNNVSPDAMQVKSPLTADKYPSYIFNDDPGRTTSRGTLALQELPRVYQGNREELSDLVYQERWPGTDRWLHALAEAVAKSQQTSREGVELRAFLHRLMNFDGRASTESAAALAYLHWQLAIVAEANSSGVDWRRIIQRVDQDQALDDTENAVLLAAVKRGIADMKTSYGTIERRFGEVFRIGRDKQHSLPIGGCTTTPFAAEGELYGISLPPPSLRASLCGAADSEGQRFAEVGQNNPLLMFMQKPISTWSAQPYGQSDVPGSPHYSDQLYLYSEKRLKPTYFHWQDLKDNIESTTVLTARF